MKEIVFKRKIYQKMLEWKRESQGETALLIEGARRVGKSTIVREFAKNEYKSYAIFDFSKATKGEKELFEDLSDMDFFFSRLRVLKDITLYERESVIIFDEVQKYPIARQAIKALVEDGRSFPARRNLLKCILWIMRNFYGQWGTPPRWIC